MIAANIHECLLIFEASNVIFQQAIQVAVAKADQAKFDADVKKKIAEVKRK